MNINSKFIKEQRIKKGLSIRALAEIAEIAASQISDLENEQLQNTTVDTICKLAIALECDPIDLFTC